MSLISENVKYFRKQLGFTQEQLSQRIGIKRSLLGAYEEGRAEPGLETLTALSRLFGVTVDVLISEALNDPEKRKEALNKDIEGRKLRVLAITVDKDDHENIQLVPQKASAGYLNGYADPEFVADLPKFYLPIFSGNGTYRAFEIKGDSMLPLPSGSMIIGQYIDNWNHVKDLETYVLVTATEGIVYKRIQNNIKKNETLKLISDNPAYEPYDVKVDDILEVWEAKAYISTDFPKPDMSVEKLTSIVTNLQKQITQLSTDKG
jgi:transcriptional regulator with XRE-family HTH domain